jgi:acetylornithine deacetylase/succinyl-diaminopimelate desuccinylase-like protein
MLDKRRPGPRLRRVRTRSGASVMHLWIAVALLAAGWIVGAAPAVLAAPVPLDRHALLAEYRDFLAIPNVAADPAGLRRTADALVAMLERRGIAARLLPASDAQAPAAVYGEWRVEGAKRTVVFYAHYDGQPVDPAAWTDPPFEPVLRTGSLMAGAQKRAFPVADEAIDSDWRLYARSASDDKAGCFALVQALAALRREGKTPSVNVKLFFDGEEEAGSPHLADILARHRELLRSDAWLIIDGPLHPDGRKQVVFGVRGDVNVDLTVYGPTRPLHSGHYGNWAPNPAMRLAQLLASMKDADGRVTIAGWYDDVVPLSAGERAAIAAVGADDAALRAELGLARSDNAGRSLLELINEPSLNVNGMRSADVGELARNVIPTTAMATLDLRVVRDVGHQRQIERLARHIEAQGYVVLDRAPTAEERARHPLIATLVAETGYDAVRTPMDTALAQAVLAAVESAAERPAVALPTSGGSLPLIVIERALGAPTLSVPIANHDNNQHAEDENLRLGNLFGGIETLRALMQMSPEW